MKNYDLTPQQLESIYIKPILSLEEASIFLGISFKHLYNLVKSNKNENNQGQRIRSSSGT